MVIINELASSVQTPPGFSLFSRILNWGFSFSLAKNLSFCFLTSNTSTTLRPQPVLNQQDCSLGSDDGFEYLRMVMDRLFVLCDDDVDSELTIQESRLLSEEPRLEELKQAFDVYDENRDGFIDGVELQKVLCGLGLEEGSEVDECKKMIKVADENGDGVIDFNEFVKFMGRKFC